MTARRRPRAPRRTPVVASPASPPPLAAETLLLDLARALTKRSVAQASDFAAVLETTATAYAADAPLAIALREDWGRSTNDKTARLALAWAREHVRVALLEIVHEARGAGVLRAEGDADTLAWLWLAACEALAHEPSSAAPDRVHALASFLTGR